jgi:hypothetical protein
MMIRTVLVLLMLGGSLIAQEPPRFDVTYLSGHAFWKANHFDAHIRVTPEAVTISQEKYNGVMKGFTDTPVFTIPIGQIQNATVTPQDDDRILITYESETVGEALLFKVRHNEAPALAARINFAKKKAQVAQTAPSDTQPAAK